MNHTPGSGPGSSLEPESPATQSKKRKAGPNTRGVALLTPEQLAKKRANDREAQRAIRERTKATIDSLERKIQHLESQEPYQELQSVIRQRDAVQAENEEIRRRLASVISVIQPIMGAHGLTHLATAAQQNVPMNYPSENNNLFEQPDQYLHNNQRQYQARSPGVSSQQDNSNYNPQYATSEQDSVEGNRAWTNPRDALNQQRDNLHRNLELNESGERLTFNFLLDSLNSKHSQGYESNNHLSSPSRPSYSSVSPNSLVDHSQAVWTMLPKYCAATCPLDNILLNFIQTRQQSSNSSSSSHLTPAYPSVSSLLNPTSGHSSDIDPISRLMTDIIGKFPNIAALPEQVATLFMMFLYMRWLIYPTQENYERLPEWFTPRPSQLFTPHPAWVDHIPWPRMRDKVIHDHQIYPFENWFLPFTSGLSVNWSYEPVDCLLATGDRASTTINPVFERHIRRLENWSLGHQFAEAYPALADTATFRGGRPGPEPEVIQGPRRGNSL